MMLKNLAPRLAERGKIKIGSKGAARKTRDGQGEWQPPQKLDHFVITTLERGPDGNFVRDDAIHQMLGSDKPRRIPVRLLFNDIEMNFMSRYACFVGKKMWCAGDGETAQRIGKDGVTRETVQCPCPRIEQGYPGKDKCKVNGALSVIIDGVPGVGNVWTFRTTSWNSVTNLTSAMYQIKALSGGVLAGLPIDLVLSPKEVTSPDGQMMKAWVVSMQFSGTVEDLRGIGYKLLEAEATHNFRVRQVEDDVRKRLALPAPSDVPLPGDDADDVVDEFYPDQAHETAAPKRPTRADFAAVGPQSEPVDDDQQQFTVYDEFGEVVGDYPTEQEALSKLVGMMNGADQALRDALAEVNPDLYAAIKESGSTPDRTTPAVDLDTERSDDPSDASGSGGGATAWGAGSAEQTKTARIPLSNSATGEVRYYSAVSAWCAALAELVDTGDWHEVWSANLGTHAKLVQSAKNDITRGHLKAVADHVNAVREAEQIEKGTDGRCR